MFAIIQSIEPRIYACSDFLSHGLFLNIQHSRYEHDINYMYGVDECRKYPLTWNGGSLYEEANFHPCWPCARREGSGASRPAKKSGRSVKEKKNSNGDVMYICVPMCVM